MLREVGSGLEDSDDLPDADREAPGNAAADAIAGRVAHLTPGQLDCLRLVDQHLSSKEIAADLFVTTKTIVWHRQSIMGKLGLRTVAELTKYAIRMGLTSLDA